MGRNSFKGTFGTPGDGGDTLLLLIPLGERSMPWSAPSPPTPAISIRSRSIRDRISCSTCPVPPTRRRCWISPLPEGRPGPVVFSSGPLSIGPELYNLTLLTQVLALNNNAKVGYQIDLDVTVTPVPEPASWAIMAAGLGVLVGSPTRAQRYLAITAPAGNEGPDAVLAPPGASNRLSTFDEEVAHACSRFMPSFRSAMLRLRLPGRTVGRRATLRARRVRNPRSGAGP